MQKDGHALYLVHVRVLEGLWRVVMEIDESAFSISTLIVFMRIIIALSMHFLSHLCFAEVMLLTLGRRD
jgi:peptidoglycan/LPS O-acetylase OafA/YrhL